MAKKLIIVTTRANILTSRGYCIGPILYPFYEETTQILGMISKGVEVLEVLADGKQIKLTNSNFDKDNSGEFVTKTNQPEPNHRQNNNYQKNNNFNKNNNKQFNKNNNKQFNNNKPNVQKEQQVQQDERTKPDVIIASDKVIAPIVADVIEEA